MKDVHQKVYKFMSCKQKTPLPQENKWQNYIILEILEETNNSYKPKVGLNFAMVVWDRLTIDVCVVTRGYRARVLEKEEPKNITWTNEYLANN